MSLGDPRGLRSESESYSVPNNAAKTTASLLLAFRVFRELHLPQLALGCGGCRRELPLHGWRTLQLALWFTIPAFISDTPTQGSVRIRRARKYLILGRGGSGPGA
eukprot:scaffold6844_cov357-Prasinococcus_capsulatus_cf.AAC.5